MSILLRRIYQKALKHHTLLHQDEGPLKCQLCHEHFQHFEDLGAHKERHHEIKETGKCEYCGNKTFNFNLKKHLEKMHQPRNCDICDLVFFDQKSMVNHRKCHRDKSVQSEIICHLCGKNFDCPRNLKFHMKIHKEDLKKCNKNFKYDICVKTFSHKTRSKQAIILRFTPMKNRINVSYVISDLKPKQIQENIQSHISWMGHCVLSVSKNIKHRDLFVYTNPHIDQIFKLDYFD